MVGWCRENRRWRSSNVWLDIVLVVVAACSVIVSLATSLLQAVGLL